MSDGTLGSGCCCCVRFSLLDAKLTLGERKPGSLRIGRERFRVGGFGFCIDEQNHVAWKNAVGLGDLRVPRHELIGSKAVAFGDGGKCVAGLDKVVRAVFLHRVFHRGDGFGDRTRPAETEKLIAAIAGYLDAV